jgi:hypothetical protein
MNKHSSLSVLVVDDKENNVFTMPLDVYVTPYRGCFIDMFMCNRSKH